MTLALAVKKWVVANDALVALLAMFAVGFILGGVLF